MPLKKPRIRRNLAPRPAIRKPIEKPATPISKPFDVALLRKKAEAGQPVSQLELAQRYQTGMGVPANAVKAVQWYQRAAAQGVLEAQFNLGLMHYLGEGTPKNLALAYRWVTIAAGKGNRRAKAVLKRFNQALPAPVFTAMVFPEPIVLDAKTTVTRQASPVSAAPAPAPAPIRKSMTTSSFWKPNVFLLGNKPLAQKQP